MSEEYKNVNKYDPEDPSKKETGHNPDDQINYTGWKSEFEELPVEKVPLSDEVKEGIKGKYEKDETKDDIKHARKKEFEKAKERQKTLETKLLLQFVDLEEMPSPQFLELGQLAIQKADEVISRIKNVQKLILADGINIPLEDDDADILEGLIGKRTIDEQAAECLNRIAFANDGQKAFYNAAKSEQVLDSSRDVLDDMFSEERIKEAFPKFGIKLIIQVVVICVDIIIQLILGKLCDMTTKIFNGKFDFRKIPLVSFIGCIGCKIAGFFQLIWNGAGDVCMWLINPIRLLAGFKLYRMGMIKVCDGVKIDIEQELLSYATQIRTTQSIPKDQIDQETGLPKEVDRCAPDYVPTNSDKSQAHRLLEVAMRYEMNAQNTTRERRDQIKKELGEMTLTKYTMLERMKSDSQFYVETSKMALKQTQPQPGYFIADRAEASILGFFGTMNGFLQKVDHTVTKTLALEFMDREWQQWLCCIVRFFYLLLPRMMAGAQADRSVKELWKDIDAWLVDNKDDINTKFDEARANADNNAKKNDELLSEILYNMVVDMKNRALAEAILKYTNSPDYRKLHWLQYYFSHGIVDSFVTAGGDAPGGRLDRIELVENVKMWIYILDALISLLLGTASLNVSLEGMLNFQDWFMSAIKMAIAEGGSILVTALYRDVKDKLFGVVNKVKEELPDVAMALEQCEPIDWFLKMLECSLENFFSKLQELMANLWMEANSAFNSFDFMISFGVTNKSLNFFKNLLDMLLNWDQALINFCSLKRTATEAEKEEIIRRSVEVTMRGKFHKTKKHIDDKVKEEIINKTGSVYDPNIYIGPDDGGDVTDNDASTANAPKIFHNTKYKIDVANGDKKGTQEEITLLDLTIPEPIISDMPPEDQVKPTEIAGEPTSSAYLQQVVKSCGEQLKGLLRDRLGELEEIHRALR